MLPDKEGSKAQVGSCVRVMVAPIDNTRGEEPKRYKGIVTRNALL